MRRILAWFRSLFRRPTAWYPHGFTHEDPHRALRDLFPDIRGSFQKPTPRQHQPFRHRLQPRQRATFRYRRQPNYRALSRALEAVLRQALVPS